jgi:hypothetical protein
MSVCSIGQVGFICYIVNIADKFKKEGVMIKKAIFLMLLVMCISTNPLAQGACTCGGYVDEEAYEECTNVIMTDSIICTDNYNSCMFWANEEFINCWDMCSTLCMTCGFWKLDDQDDCYTAREYCETTARIDWRICTDLACS